MNSNALLTLLAAVAVGVGGWGLQRYAAPEVTDVLLQLPAVEYPGVQAPWLQEVSDAAANSLRADGFRVTVLSGSAKRGGKLAYEAGLGLYLRVGERAALCSGGASVSYDQSRDAELASLWRTLYGQQWPFAWQGDNTQKPLSLDPVLWQVRGKQAELLLKLGDLACRDQRQWLEGRGKALGELLASFARAVLDREPLARPPVGAGQPGLN